MVTYYEVGIPHGDFSKGVLFNWDNFVNSLYLCYGIMNNSDNFDMEPLEPGETHPSEI